MLILLLFILVATAEMLLGIFRTLYLNKILGAKCAKRFAILPALILCLIICYFYVPVIGINTKKGLYLLGVALSTFMFLFDITIGRFLMKLQWATIFDDFNILKGNLLAIGLILMSLCPLLAYYLKTK